MTPEDDKTSWRNIDVQKQHELLCHSLMHIWQLTTKDNFQVILMKNHYICELTELETLEAVQTVGETSHQEERTTSGCTCQDYHNNICSQTKRENKEAFHSSLRQFSCRNSEHLERLIRRNLHQFEGSFGVLLFLYSIILSKGVDEVEREMDESSAKPLIDPIHGHGGQSLLNLMLTGYAVSHVWDLERDVGGLKLPGIPEQSNIGFLTLLESMRYCEVGSFLKCPKYPIWLLGSETHLTVLFTRENVDHKNPSENAIRIFKTFDEQENGFIERDKLKDILQMLELETDPDYVKFMESHLDPDSSGIILLNNFLQLFYPNEMLEKSDFAQSFHVYHYNGIPKCFSKEENKRKVMYSEGLCTLLSDDVMCLSDGPFLNCLRTKWPFVIVEWKAGPEPSLN